MNEAIANASMPADDLRKKRKAELAQARKELENIQTAIRRGILTPTTRDMLTETEERIARLEARRPHRKSPLLESQPKNRRSSTYPALSKDASMTSKAAWRLTLTMHEP